MREYKTVQQMARPLQSADLTKARVIQRRERLEQLSTEAYDSPSEWRRIADANDIDNPLKVTPGRVLKIPPMRPPSVLGDEP
jgi:nucleoid-associated protein YgaU